MLCATITEGYETALHVATGARQNHFVMWMIDLMEKEDLARQNQNGNTAFSFAAATGNIEIAEVMLMKNADLVSIRGSWNMPPVYLAVLLGKREMVEFLYDKSITYLTEEDQGYLFFQTIKSGVYDIALKLLQKQPELAVIQDSNDKGGTALHVLARKASSIFEMKATRNQELLASNKALELLKCLWGEMIQQCEDIRKLIRNPSNLLFDAVKSGNFQFLAELIRSYPSLVYELNEKKQSIFHSAILHRHIRIFNLIYEIGFEKELLVTYVDDEKNTMLHLAARYLDQPPVGGLSSAALAMQQELLIFKEVEKLMQPSLREAKNAEDLTPQELFAKEHKSLLQSGEKWMKKMASSCMLVATLITTVVFSVASTVPGGNQNQTGVPVLLRNNWFHIFAISDAIALSSSSFSILMFLSILTSGYEQTDFHKSLPQKLMIGLIALFISIISMMITFSSTFFLVYRDGSYSIPIATAIFVTVPISLFVLQQYPLMRDIVYLTYRSKFLSKLAK
ncbi:hypothetical protein ACOSP7_016046 [Xanthoceras sorbifolium]